ncbi:dead deah box helicase domain-containing protein, partial [Cystoisospora suis]
MTRNTVSLLAPPYTLEKTRRESSIRSVFSSSSKSLQLKHLPLLPSSLSFLSFRHSCLSCQRRKILDHPFFSFPSSSSSRLSSSNSFSSCRSRTSSFFFSPPCPSSTSSSFPLFSRTSSLTLSSLHSRFHLSFRLFFPPLSETLNDCLHPFRDQPQRQWIATSSLQPGRKGRKRERRHIERKEEKSLYVTKLVENHQKNGESLQRKKEGKFSFSQSPPSSLSSSASSSSSWSSSSSDSSSHPSSSRSPLSPSSSSAHSRISGEGFSRHSQSSRDDIEEKLETVSSSVCSLDQQEDVSLVDWGESSPLPTKASISSYKEKPRSFSYAPESGTRVDKINTNERGKNPNEEEEKKEESESRMKRSKEEEEERGKEEDPDGANDPGVERRVTPLTWASSDAKKLLYSETVDENSSAGIDRDLSHPVSYVGEPLDFDSYETSRSSHLSSVRSLSRDPDGPLSFSISPSSSLSSSSTLSSSSSSPSFSSSFSSSLPSSPSSTSSKVSYDRHDTPLHSPRHLNKSFEEEGRHEESSSHLVFSSVFSSLHRSLLTCLLRGGSGIITPTDVQERSIPLLLKGSSSLVLSPTGSGKTFAWMLPLLHRLIVSDKEKLAPFPQQPRSIILIPTRELGQQILTQLRRFSSVITSGVCTAGQSYVKEVRMLQKGVDVIVCTPARLMLHLHKHNLNMRRVMSMVIEEADTLCDSFFEQELTFLLSFFPHHSSASSFSSSFLDESSPAISSSSSFKHRLLPINSRQVPSSS